LSIPGSEITIFSPSMRVRELGLLLAIMAGVAGCGGDEPGDEASAIEIIVDDMGVPHIYASNDRDLFYGYGYQLACDRLLQIEMWRRFAFGRRAEILGASFQGSFGATALQDDKLVRLFNLPHFGSLDAELMRKEHPERWALVQAWRAGINRRVQEVRDGSVPRPFGFGESELDFLPELWDEADPFIIQKMIQLGLDQTLLFEILVTLLGQLKPDTLAAAQMFKPARPAWTVPPEDMPSGASGATADWSAPSPPAQRELPEWATDPALWSRMIGAPRPGSNNWAVDGRFTDNQKPMIAGDPHLVFTLMGAMYAVHLSGGSFDVAGFAFAPAPGIFAGHTRGAIWTPTSAFGDVMDLWAVQVSDQGAEIGGQIVPIVEREESILLRDGSSEPVIFRDVPGYGVIFDPLFAGVPIPLTADGRSVIIGWTGFKARSSLYFLELDRAQSVEELESAIGRIPEMSYNWLGADAAEIAYRVSLEVPLRAPIAPGREPWRVMDGSDPLALWTGQSLPPEQLPRGRAKQRGWLATANNDPFGFTADGDPANDAWYYGAFFDPGYRAQRIHEELERLTAQGNVTLEQMQNLQMDTRSLMSDDFIELLDSAWAKVGSDPALAEFSNRPELAALVQLIAVDWDRRMLRDSPGALAFHAFAHFVTARAAEDDLLSLLYERVLEAAPFYILKVAVMALRGEFPNGEKLLQEGRDVIVLQGLADTAAFLEQRFGGVAASYQWGDMHITSFDNAYGLGMPLGSAPTDGGEDTINVAHSLFRKGNVIPERWISDYGPVERMVGRFSEDGIPEIWVNFPLGNVADPASPHFDDMLGNWLDGRYEKLAFSRAEVEARSERRFEIVRR
jgi:penicillin G amidase